MSTRPANRLIHETSPYLLQHAHNPVDWWPWNADALAEARRRDVPIFLSIGYSTCYWCHVMERESFESEDIGRLMSERFVCIKVDREERPDIDDLYMAAVQMMTGHGGWPMSCFLEPHGLRPFFCGTYFPPAPAWGRPGFPQILEAMSKAWAERRNEVLEQAEAVREAVVEHLAARAAPVGLSIDVVSRAAQGLMRMLDRINGGFGSQPKFPQPVFVELLLDVRDSAGDDATRQAADHAVRLTLDRMAIGGLHDQIAGGFHRYCVDESWTVPHFEKMLYDNAQLAALYARAAATYNDDFYERVARRTIDYVMREMRGDGESKPGMSSAPERHLMFFSAQDAEVDGREGLNVVWTREQVEAALSPELASLAVRIYGLDRGTNFKDPHHPEAAPTNVLRLSDRPERVAGELGLDLAAFLVRLDEINAGLMKARAARTRPRLDDKVLAAWNGMMISALARASRFIEKRDGTAPREWRSGAGAAMAVLLTTLVTDGELARAYRAGRAHPAAFLEDYAWVITALIDLHEAGATRLKTERGEVVATLAEAKRLCDRVDALFGDGHGGFFDTRDGQQDLFVRARSTHDGAVPSGSSVMVHNLVALHRVTGDPALLDRAIAALAAISPDVARNPIGTCNALRSLLTLVMMNDGVAERVAAIGPPTDEPAEESDFTPVEIYASAERIAVGKDSPAVVRLVLKIAPGYHINAAQPGNAGGAKLMPLRVGVVGGSGVGVSAEYPEGEAYGPGGELRVHTGQVEFRVLVERVGEWTGRPLLTVTFQACTDRACMEPRTAELDVAIDRID